MRREAAVDVEGVVALVGGDQEAVAPDLLHRVGHPLGHLLRGPDQVQPTLRAVVDELAEAARGGTFFNVASVPELEGEGRLLARPTDFEANAGVGTSVPPDTFLLGLTGRLSLVVGSFELVELLVRNNAALQLDVFDR